jgi:hypothetical protein
LLHGARQQNAAFRHFGVRDIKAIIWKRILCF